MENKLIVTPSPHVKDGVSTSSIMMNVAAAMVPAAIAATLIFGVRAIHTRTMLRIRWDAPKLLICCLLLGVQCVVMESAVPLWQLWSGLCLLVVAAMNYKPLRQAFLKAM